MFPALSINCLIDSLDTNELFVSRKSQPLLLQYVLENLFLFSYIYNHKAICVIYCFILLSVIEPYVFVSKIVFVVLFVLYP